MKSFGVSGEVSKKKKKKGVSRFPSSAPRKTKNKTHLAVVERVPALVAAAGDLAVCRECVF